ncbi:MAG: helix-turn-helix domain-containing protein [Lachnospiraceae bacterium]|nr:helix-turn-helix domain-containing protein [Lachnospiraceae bacterium]
MAEWLNCLSALMQKYAQMEERLIQALLNQAPLTDVLNICEEILDNPVALYDAHLNLLGQSNLFEKGFVPNQYWTESALLQYVSADLLHRLKNSGVAEKLVKSKKAMLVDLKDGSEPYMTCNLFLNHDSENVHVGSISLFAANRSICPEDAELLEQISAAVAGRTEKEAQGHDLRISRTQQIIIDLMHGKLYGKKTVKKVFSDFHSDVSKGVNLMVFQMEPEQRKGGVPEYIRIMIEGHVGHCQMIAWENESIALYPAPVHDRDSFYDYLEECLSKIQIHSGCSMEFTEWENLHQQYVLAKAALEIGLKMRPKETIYFYSDYAVSYPISLCEKEMDIRLLCLPEIWKLYQHDKEERDVLTESLYSYLICERSISKAAKDLNVHKSTLGYRLHKAEDIVGLDIENPGTRQKIIFSCEIIRYLKCFE